MTWSKTFILLGLWAFQENAAWAAVPRQLGVPTQPKSLMERAGDEIEDSVKTFADSLDSLLSGSETGSKERNKSQAKLSYQVIHREGGHLSSSPDFSLNLRLPKLERKWQLRFTSYDEEAEDRSKLSPYSRVKREKKLAAGIGLFRQLGKIKVSFRPRLVLKDPLEMSYVLRFERSGVMGPFELRMKTDLYADAEKGTGEYVELGAGVKLGRFDVSTTHKEEYKERGNEFTTGHGFTAEYPLTKTIGLYQTNTFGFTNRPVYHLTDIDVATGYGQVLKPNRLYYSFGPSLNFSKGRRFKGEAAVSLSVALEF